MDLEIRIGRGRDAETKKRVGEAIFGTLCDALRDSEHWPHLSLSLEMREIDPAFSWKQNQLHERVKEREGE